MRGNAQHKTVECLYFRNYGNMDAWISSRPHSSALGRQKISRISLLIKIHRIDSPELYVVVIRDFGYFVIGWLGQAFPVDWD